MPDDEKKEISEVVETYDKKENTENTENTEKKEKQKLDARKKKMLFRFLFYVISFVYSLIMFKQTTDITVTLGDFGSIATALMEIVSSLGFKWIPLFSLIGFILSFFPGKFENIHKVYIIVISIILVVSTLLFVI